jgi:polysaccharide biosynthesis protein PslG
MQRWLYAALLILLAACGRGDRPAATPGSRGPVGELSRTTEAAAVEPTVTVPARTATPRPGAPLTHTPLPSATSAPTFTPEPAYPLYTGTPIDQEDTGVQIHLHREDLDGLMAHLEQLGVGWVKSQVSWKLYEPGPGEYDDFRLGELDRLVARAEEAGIRVMLSVAKAPEWSRWTTEMDGPPRDPARFRAFMAFLAGRYQGRVAAYELWNEPNLQREWYGVPLSAAALVELIAAGAEGVRAVDGEAALISAAPATTGVNDGVVAIDDRVYLREMVAAGVTEVVDAIGAHPYGWANRAEATADAPGPGAPSHSNHPSFFFADTLNDYRAILVQGGQPDMAIWVTEFGWGSYQRLERDPPAEVSYMAYVDEWQQALYTMRAYEMAAEMGGLGPMMLWNLNFGPTFGAAYPESAYSLLRPDGSPRPVYRTLATMTGGAGGPAPGYSSGGRP